MKKLLIMAIITAILAMISLSMTGCKKTVYPQAPLPYYQAPQEAVDHLVLPVGSYFIYKDSTTGLEDSVVVKESSLQKIFVATHIVYTMSGSYMVFDANADSLTLKMTNESATGSPLWLLISHRHETGSSTYYYDKKNGFEEDPVFWNPVPLPVNDETNGGFIIPSMSVEGVIYTNVYRFRSTKVSIRPSGIRKVDFYWVKGIGLIKKVIAQDTSKHSWTLVRKG